LVNSQNGDGRWEFGREIGLQKIPSDTVSEMGNEFLPIIHSNNWQNQIYQDEIYDLV